jgi:hypothetical protein
MRKSLVPWRNGKRARVEIKMASGENGEPVYPGLRSSKFARGFESALQCVPRARTGRNSPSHLSPTPVRSSRVGVCPCAPVPLCPLLDTRQLASRVLPWECPGSSKLGPLHRNDGEESGVPRSFLRITRTRYRAGHSSLPLRVASSAGCCIQT